MAKKTARIYKDGQVYLGKAAVQLGYVGDVSVMYLPGIVVLVQPGFSHRALYDSLMLAQKQAAANELEEVVVAGIEAGNMGYGVVDVLTAARVKVKGLAGELEEMISRAGVKLGD